MYIQTCINLRCSLRTLIVILLLSLGAFLLNPAVSHAEPASTPQIQAYCFKVVPKKAQTACSGSGQNGNELLNSLMNTATYHCTDRPIADSQKATCIFNAAKALIDKTLRTYPNPQSASEFANDLKRVLLADAQAHNGSTTKPSPDSLEGEAPTSYCGAADCPAPVADPALCAIKPSTTGCNADANANCTKNSCDLVKKYINPGIDLLSIIFGLIAAISLILGGIQYASSAGDPQKASAAKKRITMTVVAFIAYAFLYGFVQFLVPGGAFK